MRISLSRTDNHRKSLIRNLTTSLILYEKIKTTKAKAKETKKMAEKLIFLAKKNDLNARRTMIGYFFDKNATKKMFEVLSPRYEDINTGFIEEYRLTKRLGDGSDMVLLRLRNILKAPIIDNKSNIEDKDNAPDKITKKDSKKNVETGKQKTGKSK
ncbi:MAG: 50S ribosomal protein L17 [Berkelbacteria bacterium GW2011_GWB1_38_5]|uniref:50S ribosomal protein L17 n=2 Tax=Candidatus Berkelbacteria TaxID=1618330 RepID=A0A0G0PNP7_9BACT|nr:MAG: 50S ribosomal protein L17 [Berkelbacteria bacterium GW2011_GWB1_38_5]KKQ90946.1 MAG: 50S ribosomal protein L17 [Berkelbacteria bacterium GW2011_GWA1_39_10]